MISHIFVGITDFDRAFRFYSAIMHPLGLHLKFSEPGRHWAGWMAPELPRPLFLIGRPFNGEPAAPGNGNMTALLGASRDIVDQTHAAALAGGGTCEGPPALRPHYHANYYGAYFRDPDGNKLCVCCHEPAPQ